MDPLLITLSEMTGAEVRRRAQQLGLDTFGLDVEETRTAIIEASRTTPAEISKEQLQELYADLKGSADSGGWMEGDAFRYEMFARRLVAAEYGRLDAVEWALQWHADLISARRAREAAQEEAVLREQASRDEARAEFLAGRCGNPRYQAFLDTVEDPSTCLNNHAGYMAFISAKMAEFERMCGRPPAYDKTGEWGKRFTQYLRDDANQNLSQRVRRTHH